ncbi:hypothetical protein QZH41_019891 [Actinostola sp. cb2023]|nr:hypothetical protein QZH41_019891 [Actinostola sp. cb2023]
MDEFCPEVRKDVTKVYHSIAVRKLVHKISSIVNGLPESQIFPVINYSKVLELKDNMDILLLYALRQMLILAEEHLEIHREQLTIEPWRNLKGWDRSVRDELKEHVASLAPVTSDEITVPTFNILLTGQIGAGKSSFFNSLNSLFRNRIIAGKADTGLKTAESWTKEFRIYNLITPDHNIPSPLPWRICDTMGLNDNTDESDIRNVLKAVDGHVPNKYTFTVGIDFDNECPGFVVNPTLAEKAHCIAVVVDASKVKVMKTDMWYKLRSLREGFISRNIPTYIILTHIDQACEKVNKDVQHVYRSIIIRDIVATVGKELLGLPENQIFPVRNYEKEDDLYDDMDILLLHAVRQMLYSAQGHIENKM